MAQTTFAEDFVVFPQDDVSELNLETGACEGEMRWYMLQNPLRRCRLT